MRLTAKQKALNIKDKYAILVDEMADTAGSLVNAAEALMQNGAKEVYACCTHAILSGPTIERIKNCSIRELLTLNTISRSEEKRIDKIRTISVASIFADAINCIHENSPVSKLFIKEVERRSNYVELGNRTPSDQKVSS